MDFTIRKWARLKVIGVSDGVGIPPDAPPPSKKNIYDPGFRVRSAPSPPPPIKEGRGGSESWIFLVFRTFPEIYNFVTKSPKRPQNDCPDPSDGLV